MAGVTGTMTLGGCGDDGTGLAWDPMTTTVAGSGDSDPSGDESASPTADDTAGPSCEPGATQPCLCPDGLSLGEQSCDADGVGFSECECEMDTESAEGSTGDPMPPLPAEICFLGADRSGTACIPLGAFYAELPAGYEYPPSMSPDGQDRPPLGLLDLDAVDPSMALAPNFALDEFASAAIGRWAVIQPHAIDSLQNMRDAAGSIAVEVGYLSPSDNEAMGGELYARHQYGDGFDLDPNDTDVATLAGLCTAEGGEAVQFEAHIHCEFSGVPLDEGLFGPSPSGGAPAQTELARLDAWIEADGHGYWAPAVGFIEGEPRRRWEAIDAAGRVLVAHEGRSFGPPPGTARVEVTVGGRLHRSIEHSR